MGNSSNSQNQRKNSQNGAKNRRNRRNNIRNRQNHTNNGVAVNNNSANSANTTQKTYNNSRNSYASEKNTTPSDNTRIIAEESENTSENASASASKNHNANTRTNTENAAKKPRNVEISTFSEGSTAESAPVEHSSRRNRRHRRHVDFDSIVDEAETLDNNHTNAHTTTTNSRSSRSDRRRKNGQNYAQNGENEEKPVKTGWSEDEMSVILDSTTMGAIKRNNALFFWEIDGLLKSNGTQHSWVYLKNNPPKLTFKRPKEQPFTIFLGKEEVNQLAPALEAVRKAYNAVPIQEKKKEKWTLHNFASIFKNKFYENPGLMVAKIAAIVVMIGIAIFALCL